MNKLPVSELLRLACIFAEQDREEFLRSYSHIPGDPEAAEAREYLEQLKAYRLKRWGKTRLEGAIEAGTPKTLLEILTEGS